MRFKQAGSGSGSAPSARTTGTSEATSSPSRPSPTPLALFGGAPVRVSFPEPRPRLTPEEAGGVSGVLHAAAGSGGGDDWPLPPVDALEERWARAHGAAHAAAV